MTDIASTFLGSDSSLGQFTESLWSQFHNFHTFPSLFFTRANRRQTKLPPIVLTSERTSSAAGDFHRGAQGVKRAVTPAPKPAVAGWRFARGSVT